MEEVYGGDYGDTQAPGAMEHAHAVDTRPSFLRARTREPGDEANSIYNHVPAPTFFVPYNLYHGITCKYLCINLYYILYC